MNLHQRVRIPLDQNAVWQALNDPEVLKQCMPGCESFERTSEDAFEFALTAKVGPVKAKFVGDVALSEIDAPNSYVISGGGKGGVAGFAKGSAKVNLSYDGTVTLLTYQVEAKVGGKLAQIGSRLVMGAAKKMANDFFAGFVRVVLGNENLDIEIESLEDESKASNQ